MNLLQKVTSKAFICKIYIDYIGALNAVSGAENQNFFDSTGNEFTWKSTHFIRNSVSFRETEKITASGSEYTQTLQFSFLNSDAVRTDRIEKIKTAKFVQIALSNGQLLVLGRNDFFQNKKPEIKVSSTDVKSTVSISTKSIFSIGHLHINSVSEFIEFLFPSEIPKLLITTS